MKRTVICLAMATVTAALWCESRSAAQQPVPQPQPQPQVQTPRPLQTRIGLMNLQKVLKEYKKFQTIEDNIKNREQALVKTLEPYRTEIIRLTQMANDPKTPQDEKDKIAHRIPQLKLDGSQKEEEARKELVKMQGDAFVMIYKEVEDVVNFFARSNNLELVLFYNDAVNRDDFYRPNVVGQKFSVPAALIPMFVTPGMDITDTIIQSLNSRYNPTASAVPAPGGVPVAPGGAAPRPPVTPPH